MTTANDLFYRRAVVGETTIRKINDSHHGCIREERNRMQISCRLFARV